MAVINTGLIEKGLKSDFFHALSNATTHYGKLATRVPSTTKTEQYAWLGQVPTVREWTGGRHLKGLNSESYDVTNLKYEATIAVDRDEIDDDQTGQIRLRINELAERAAQHKDYLIEQLLLNGGASGFNSYDGVTFFNSAHVTNDSGDQSNDLTYAAADGTTPTVAEFRQAVKQAIAKMASYKDDQGQSMRIDPGTGLVIVTPPAMWFTALDAMSLAVASTADDPLARNILQKVAEVIMMPGLESSPAAFYLCKINAAVRPFIFQDRMPIEFASLAERSESEFRYEQYLYGVRARYAMTYGYWQYCIRTNFT